MILFDLTPLANVSPSMPVAIALLIALGLAIGFVAALFGIGGGFLLTPFLHSVTMLPAVNAVATSLGQIPFTGLSGVLKYMRARVIHYPLLFWLLCGSLPSAQIVAHYLGSIKDTALGTRPLWNNLTAADLLIMGSYVIVIGTLAILNLYKGFRATPAGVASPAGTRQQSAEGGPANTHVSDPDDRQLPYSFYAWTFVMGVVFGSFSVLLGIGGGFFAFPFFVYYCKRGPVEAVATSLLAIVITSGITLAHYIVIGQVYLGISLLVAVGGVVGARLGASFAIKTQPNTIVRSLGLMQVAAVIFYVAMKLA